MSEFAIGFAITALLSVAFLVLYARTKRANGDLVRSNYKLEAELDAARSKESDTTILAKAIAADISKEQERSFKSTAVDPMDKMVRELNSKIGELDKQNVSNNVMFSTNMKNMMSKASEVESGTKALSDILKSSQKRGRHAEVRLERVFEMSGLTKGMHYDTQTIMDEGKPDFVVKLSQDRVIIVDSKAPLESLWKSFDTDDEAEKSNLVKKHIEAVKVHVKNLSKKEYGKDWNSSLDYVVMVMPEYAMLPALEHDNGLVDYALEKKVILVTPSTLMVLLRAVDLMWRQTKLSDTVREISNLSSTLHERLNKFAGYYNTIGSDLMKTAGSYNTAISSWNKRMLPAANKLAKAGAVSTDIVKMESIEKASGQLPIDDD